MLNSLASYLLGYPGSTAAASPADADRPASARASVPSVDVDVRLSAVEADDDWLLVDKTGKNVGHTHNSKYFPKLKMSWYTLAQKS